LQTLTDFELGGFDVTASDLWTFVSNGRKVSGTRVCFVVTCSGDCLYIW
jgi:hypothetical protein